MVTSSLQRRLLRELAYIIVFGTPLVLFFLIAMPRSNAARLTKSLEPVAVNRIQRDGAAGGEGERSGRGRGRGD